MASFRNLLGLPVKLWDDRSAGQVLQLSSDKEHWEFGAGGGGGTASHLTTKGDLYGYDTGNARIPVGTDGQVLVADSSQAVGVKWAQGNGIHIDDRVATYASLPSPPTEGTGATYLVDADGLLYVWDGSSWPDEWKGVSVGSASSSIVVYADALSSNAADIGYTWRVAIKANPFVPFDAPTGPTKIKVAIQGGPNVITLSSAFIAESKLSNVTHDYTDQVGSVVPLKLNGVEITSLPAGVITICDEVTINLTGTGHLVFGTWLPGTKNTGKIPVRTTSTGANSFFNGSNVENAPDSTGFSESSNDGFLICGVMYK